MILAACCVLLWIVVMAILMSLFGLLENPRKRLSFTQSSVVVIVGVGLPVLLLYLYDFHADSLELFFIVMLFIAIVITTFCTVFVGKSE